MALKIVVSRASPDRRESRTLQTLARINNSSHPGCKHIVRLLDDFSHAVPNGTHPCLVFELLGPSVATIIEEIFPDSRLLGVPAKRVCKEMLLAVDFLQEQNIGHGGQSACSIPTNARSGVEMADLLSDLRTRNIAFTIPSLDSISEETLLDRLRILEQVWFALSMKDRYRQKHQDILSGLLTLLLTRLASKPPSNLSTSASHSCLVTDLKLSILR